MMKIQTSKHVAKMIDTSLKYVHPRTGHERPAGGGGVKIHLHFFFDLGSGWGWVVNTLPSPGLFGPRKREPVPILQEAVWAPGPVWTGAENLVLTRIRSLNRPARSEPLYGLSYPGTLASYFISNKVVDGGNILFVYCYNKIHNAALCGVYLDSCAAIQLPPASKFQ
jgi:hypothetical protein